MSEAAGRIAELSPRKRELLLRHLERRGRPGRGAGQATGSGTTRRTAAVIPRRPAGSGPAPLSFAQERLWILDQLEPGNPAYNVYEGLSLDGALDTAALRWAVSQVVRRHGVLRTTLERAGGEGVQVIASGGPAPLPLVDLRRLGGAGARGELDRLADEEALRPFELARGPLCRFVLVRLGAKRHAFFMTLHHVITDAASMSILFRDLVGHYEARVAAGVRPPAPPALGYADYAAWQRGELRGEILEAQLAFWKARLETAQAELRLPADRPRPKVRSYRGGRRPLALPPGAGARLDELARGRRATLFMTLLAAFTALLHRYSEQTDVSVGTPVANRDRTELRDLVGLFVNTLVLRTRLTGRDTFTALLDRVRAGVLDAYAHLDLPFEKIVEALQPKREMAKSPLFQVMLVLNSGPSQVRRLSALDVRRVTVPTRTVKFDLTLSLVDSDGRLAGALDYDVDLFDAVTVRRMAAHLRTLLEEVPAHPERRLDELARLGRAQRHQLSREWNDTSRRQGRGPGHEETLVGLFLGQARRRPESIAAVFGEAALTYGGLALRADRLAAALCVLGAGPGQVVALLMERSLDLAVALLGVLRTGTAYVPLDPGFPARRLEFVLEDTRARVVLADGRFRDRVRHGRVVSISDTDSAGPPPALCGPCPESAAYVIYTSGSTGRPKGVVVSHRAITNRLLWMQARHPLGPGDRVLQKTPISFDASIWELFVPWSAGAPVVFAAPEAHGDSSALVAAAERHGVTVLQLVPSMLTLFLEQEAARRLGALRRLFAGGEILGGELARQALELTGADLVNLYGPTEASIDVTSWALGKDRTARRTAADGSVPIGRPITNTRVHLLGRTLRPVPPGVAGQLCATGRGLARGYLGRAALTAGRFVPDACSGAPGQRLYLTGDLARHRHDGVVEYLGRLDHQVKVRGLRIEPGEIESALRRDPSIREAAVVVRHDGGGHHLVAFVAAAAPRRFSVPRCRAALGEKLPRWMVPTGFVVLEALPRTPGGKIDRHTLATSKAVQERPAAGRVAPRNPLELRLVRLWEEVLDTTPISVTDGFFDLGGHSLLAVRLLSLAEKRFGARLPLAAFFDNATIEDMAHRLGRDGGHGEAGAPEPLVALQSSGSRSPLFCVHPAGGDVFCYLDLAYHLGPEQPVYALRDPRTVDGSRPDLGIEEMAALYVEAMRGVCREGPYLLAGWSLGGTIAFEMARQLEQHGLEVGLLAVFDTWAPGARGEDPAEAPEDLDEALLLWFGRQLGMRLSRRRLRDRAPQERLEFVLEEARAAGSLPRGLETEDAHELFVTCRAEMDAERRYAPSSGVRRLVLVRAGEHLERTAEDPTLGWASLCAEVDVQVSPGTHQSLLREPHVEDLARRLGGYLEKAGGERPASAAAAKDTGARPPGAATVFSTGRRKVDAVLQGVIDLFETVFPDRVRGYYLTGSQAEKTAVSGSDIDGYILFKDAFQSAGEAEKARRLAYDCALLASPVFEMVPMSENQLRRHPDVHFHLGSVLLYGEDVRDRVPLPPMDFHARMLAHRPIPFFRRVRGLPEALRFPLGYPDPDAEACGYERAVPGEDGGLRVSVKELINCVGKPALALVTRKAGIYVRNKTDCLEQFRRHVGGAWSQLLDEVYARCRDAWGYELPEGEDERRALRDLCRRTLDFENHYLAFYRDFLLAELAGAEEDFELWLSTAQAEQFGIPETLLEQGAAWGELERRREEGEDLVRVPQAQRVLAACALARVVYPDPAVRESLVKLREDRSRVLRWAAGHALRVMDRIPDASTAEDLRRHS